MAVEISHGGSVRAVVDDKPRELFDWVDDPSRPGKRKPGLRRTDAAGQPIVEVPITLSSPILGWTARAKAEIPDAFIADLVPGRLVEFSGADLVVTLAGADPYGGTVSTLRGVTGVASIGDAHAMVLAAGGTGAGGGRRGGDAS
ncbi:MULTISPECIES: hypothetical protein [Mycobacteroides]|uniref:hypothetical protein n=1 Tax=Mycobacteroides TaxID=670516 RepID=UPI000712D938|nr:MULTISPECIES: hypothetical protein [Mycobacteroides]KRQ20028.1 hypothetical protein AOT86_24090 [Mycobacteroides sp. H072]KRQ29760.1 hypothetical protein AOT84_26130 [Mycobacteroides sp. H002]KRQ48369.1 hypothetical protein AOT85_18900 [Mycobacteroides sp. H054]OHU43667.1 hypothetical protein BKG79_07235 [Mycobacteroides chelonae]